MIGRAALNNVLQSEAVLAALGSPGIITEEFWVNQHCLSVPYANGGTLGVDADPQHHLDKIAQLTSARPPDATTYVMDSWAALDLTSLGYEIRFTDEWFIRHRRIDAAGTPGTEDVRLITSKDELAEFERASVLGFDAQPVDAASGQTYVPALLDDDRFRFFGLYVNDALVSGVFLFEDPWSVGVFTFFTLPAFRGQGLGSNLLRVALRQAPDLPIATNPSPMSRGIFSKLGFQPVGERRLWVR